MKTFFTPGPSELFYTLPDHLRAAIKENIGSINHRSEDFSLLYKETTSNLRSLLGFGDEFSVLFMPAATEVWPLLIANCAPHKSAHFVNGAFSRKFYQTALDLRTSAQLIEIPLGSGFTGSEDTIPSDVELIALAQNETSTGVAQPMDSVYQLRELYPEALIALDVVSSLPHPTIDFSKIDCAYFSVQKCFGLPPGLGVCIINSRCLEKSLQVAQNAPLPVHKKLSNLFEWAAIGQTAYTPNVLGIYLLNKVCQDMLEKGLEQIRRETEYKAAVLYQVLENHANVAPFVKEEKYRSKTIVVGEMANPNTVIEYLASNRMIIGGGYGQHKNDHFRIANFPTHSKERVEQLADLIAAFE